MRNSITDSAELAGALRCLYAEVRGLAVRTAWQPARLWPLDAEQDTQQALALRGKIQAKPGPGQWACLERAPYESISPKNSPSRQLPAFNRLSRGIRKAATLTVPLDSDSAATLFEWWAQRAAANSRRSNCRPMAKRSRLSSGCEHPQAGGSPPSHAMQFRSWAIEMRKPEIRARRAALIARRIRYEAWG